MNNIREIMNYISEIQEGWDIIYDEFKKGKRTSLSRGMDEEYDISNLTEGSNTDVHGNLLKMNLLIADYDDTDVLLINMDRTIWCYVGEHRIIFHIDIYDYHICIMHKSTHSDPLCYERVDIKNSDILINREKYSHIKKSIIDFDEDDFMMLKMMA